ncbi:DUF3073 domain-containing protein [Corynebacterium pygosceleis]|uniref:DUF3073 domain-containing protein n=1 Tax=Corynebacterium pygosceleis TaxID=2800406 RepID=A0A9Q4CA14_9CORY|nr:DUF3073 domain-containing protein [Corynebacterium pygosceleis]MCK7638485.1 DUF3073 domain-containing protein [Corynebacterium pygosceleis]MCK7675465.1 DUF3073 domain-containing protein [Corynebacterium pygosceleis]MCL0121141.1 DUF3073 domain-containing protein [Corynebacterium pygosceleis]MCX7445355.1 DUF3073 domain-containing protein [Corynebacterium pygosceleis]MCX7469149.1 DUF3073 domain-containing protein [Corynebacterium pygosceleis]
MGRGRAKAKQAKVARQLKYNIPDMDLDSLQRELSGRDEGSHHSEEDRTEDPYDQWSDWSEDDGADDDSASRWR